MLVLAHAFIRIVLARAKHAAVCVHLFAWLLCTSPRLSFTSIDGDRGDGVVLRETLLVCDHRSGADARGLLRAVGPWLGEDRHVKNGAHHWQHGVVGQVEVGWLGTVNRKKNN